MKVITITNQKGGVGKTATVSALIGYMQEKKKRILAIDLDSQRNLSLLVGAEPTEKTLIDVLTGNTDDIQELITTTRQCDIIQGTPDLSNADTFISLNNNIKGIQEFYIFKAFFEHNRGILDTYDYVIIDTPPRLDKLLHNALYVTDYVIIPLEADIMSIVALNDIVANIDAAKETNPDIETIGTFTTRHNGRAVISKTLSDKIEQECDRYDIPYIDTPIREAVAIKEAKLMQQNIFEYQSNANVTNDYRTLFERMNL